MTSQLIESTVEAMNFNSLKVAVARQFERMQKHAMFRVNVEKDDLWAAYLGAFPAGTNRLFRERTEYDCSCCRQFIRSVGNIVAVIDGKMVSIWDVSVPDEPTFEIIAAALSALVKSRAITEPFLHYERTAGTDKNFEQIIGEAPRTWNHFFINIAPSFVVPKAKLATQLGEERATYDVFKRSLETITVEAIDTALEMISQGSLYRGAEHEHAIDAFRKLKVGFSALRVGADISAYLWTAYKAVPASVSRIRNTVIGTLLVDLSEGADLEAAVGAFEAKVAPANYKRPSALVTKAMIEKAKATLAELGLTSALDRRYANINDITINNILFADRSARKAMGDVFDELSASAGENVKNFDKVEEVPIDKFIADILPRAESIEVMLENQHASSLVSLIAPVDPTAGHLFKWDNNFSWSYNGEMADSIKERVKKAGGNVTGDLCCRLAWDYADDLDFHMMEPNGGHIYFPNKRTLSRCGGMLDVDANGGDGLRENPVENIFYASRVKMTEGVYELKVNNFSRRSDGAGFECEIDYLGSVHRFAYAKVLRTGETIRVARFTYSHKGGIELLESLPSSQAVRTVWGLPTQTFNKVKVMMLSPNHWDDKPTGNKHYFFMLEGCVNDGTARGFFNEFLKSEFDKHRKVFEIVGGKTKPADTTEQLSGLGFSSTSKNTLVCRVKGSFSRIIKIVF